MTMSIKRQRVLLFGPTVLLGVVVTAYGHIAKASEWSPLATVLPMVGLFVAMWFVRRKVHRLLDSERVQLAPTRKASSST